VREVLISASDGCVAKPCVLQEEEIEIALDMDEAAIAKYDGKLLASYDGPSAEVFCKVGCAAALAVFCTLRFGGKRFFG